MNKFILSFAEIIILKENLIEIIIDEGIEVSAGMVNEFHDFLLTYLEGPFRILINSKNSYSYTFRAQIQMANLKEIEAIGVSAETKSSMMSIETMIFLSKNNSCNIDFEIFKTRIEALAWLQNPKLISAI